MEKDSVCISIEKYDKLKEISDTYYNNMLNDNEKKFPVIKIDSSDDWVQGKTKKRFYTDNEMVKELTEIVNKQQETIDIQKNQIAKYKYMSFWDLLFKRY